MFNEFITKRNLPKFRLKQLWLDYYQKGLSSAEDLTVWPLDLRSALAAEVDFELFQKVTESVSKNGDTRKILFARKSDGKKLEAVLMRHKSGRNTVCVSCMIGCPVGCIFCATGKLGFQANLSSDEIVEQVLYFQRELMAEGAKVTNVVFMGMGEPLLNLDNVLEAINILTDPDKVALSDRRIAVSTSGYYQQIPKLLAAGFKGKLAISLHAPNQALREKLMPMAKTNKLSDLFAALDNYVAITNKRIFYEYLLLNKVNDSDDQALELARLLQGRLAHVNLIPFNDIPGSDLVKSRRERVANFMDILANSGISVSVRASMGSDIAGACGQLAARDRSIF